MRGVFAGSGADALNEVVVCNTIIQLSGKVQPTVLYLGTASYDNEASKTRQTQRFAEAGCLVVSLDCAHSTPSPHEIDAAFQQADILLVSGGNTLFAVDRWNHLGISDRIKSDADRLVLAGGSAGAICWFDGGHSDSADPASFRHPVVSTPSSEQPEALQTQNQPIADWKYIRIDGLGLFPGLLCPHHDKIQSNGVLRAIDLNEMLLRHPNERAICIDHFAALVVSGDSYSVLSLNSQPGSVGDAGEFLADRSGHPGIWLKEVEHQADGVAIVKHWLLPGAGKLSECVRAAEGDIISDPRVQLTRAANSAIF